MTRPYALLRAGFPYLKTLGTLVLTEFPVDVAVTKDLRAFVLRKTAGPGGVVTILTWEDEHVAHLRDPFVLPPAGTPASSPTPAPGDQKILWPAAIILDSDENLVISDEARNRITFLTQDGDIIDQWGEPGDGPGQMDRPSGIAFDPDGNLYVVDAQNHRVQRFNKDGKFMTAWGGRGDGPGEFDMPWGIHVDELGDVYVVDWHNDRVQKFTAEGEFIFQFGRSGSGDGELNRPSTVAVDADGDIYVADLGNNRVQLFNAEGRYVEKFLGDAVMSKSGRIYMLSNARELRMREMSNAPDDEKRFRNPRSVRADGEGRIFVTDYYCSRVQIYQKDAIPLDESQIWAPVRAPSLLMP
jgi:DNA-binding beta-propeller fold protein YncE